jgi:hypothetical protein
MKKIFKLEIILSLIIFVILILITLIAETTGDSGDSITHYLYSHYSFKYPEFFLHHWAKPIFVLCSSPFAQFGFKGIIVFNCTCASLSALFTFYTARNLKIKNPWLVFIIIFFTPLYFKLIFSGLTEYLFGLFLIIGIYLITKLKHIPALIIISFLPLVRSEGLLIIGLFGLYYLFNEQFRKLPYLLVGQLVYTVVGAFYFNDILWVINKIPYANIGSPYGHGSLFDFIHRLNYVIEKPVYILLSIGSISLLYSAFRSGLRENNDIKIIFVLGSFLSLFVAHSLFWWLGIFNSMGLPRVLIAVVPLIGILSLIGVQAITDKIQNLTIKYSLLAGIVLLVCYYPFSSRPEGVVFNDQMLIVEGNRLIDDEVAPYIKKEFPDYSTSKLYFSHPYLSLALKVDYFDQNYHKEIQDLLTDNISDDEIIIWDDWYSTTVGEVSLEFLTNDNRFELLQTFQKEKKGRKITYAIFKTTANNT